MVILITFKEGNKTLVSHGIDTATLHTVHLPVVPPAEIGRYDSTMGEWVLKEVKA